MSRERNNLKAGIFIIIGLALAFGLIVMMSNFSSLFTPMQKVVVEYKLSDGLKGIHIGSAVTVGNVPAGRVNGIEDVLQEGVVVAQRVHFVIPGKYKLFDNAIIELVPPLLGTGTKLNIDSFGYNRGDQPGYIGTSWLYESGSVIHGGIAKNQVANQLVHNMGIQDKQRLQVQNIIANIEKITATLAENPEKFQTIIDNVEQITTALKEDLPALTEGGKQFITQLNKRSKVMWDRVDETTENVRLITGDVREIVSENRDDIRESIQTARKAVEHAEELVEHARTVTITKVDETLDKARHSIDEIKQITTDLKTFVAAEKPVLERTIANMRLTSDQLKLAAIEVRRSPWRLLYKPSEKELDTDNLYDAARSFALAAGTLDNTAESLRMLMKQYGDKLDPNDPQIKHMLENLNATFEKFAGAEDQFWKALGEQKGAKKVTPTK